MTDLARGSRPSTDGTQNRNNNQRFQDVCCAFPSRTPSSKRLESGGKSREGDVRARQSKEASVATQIVMDHTGDTRHEFDPRDREALAAAERRFRELTGAGFTAATRLADGKSEVVRSFDPAAEETVFVPRLRGG